MSQVKFLRGKTDNLKNVSLENGSIYFTTDERKLYIDTAGARLPITTQTVIEFNVELKDSGWIFSEVPNLRNEFTVTQIITKCTLNGKEVLLSEILNENSIVHMNNSLKDSAIIISEVSGDKITFQLLGTKVAGFFTEITNKNSVNLPSGTIALYTPNPKATYNNQFEAFKTAAVVEIITNTQEWFKSEETYIKTIYVEDIDLSNIPVMIDTSYYNATSKGREIINSINILEINYDEDLKVSEIILSSPIDLTDTNINLEFNIIAIIAENENNNGVWTKVVIKQGAEINNNQVIGTVAEDNLSLINENLNNVLIYSNNSSSEYLRIKGLSENTLTNFYFDVYPGGADTIQEDISLYVIQLDSIAQTLDIVLDKNNWESELTEDGEIKYYTNTYELVKVDEDNNIINNQPLYNKRPPLIMVENNQKIFNQIKEIKTYQTKIVFYLLPNVSIEELEDLKLTIIDFK